jgi:hypothetical protein
MVLMVEMEMEKYYTGINKSTVSLDGDLVVHYSAQNWPGSELRY